MHQSGVDYSIFDNSFSVVISSSSAPPPIPGDRDDDNVVDYSDYVFVTSNFGVTTNKDDYLTVLDHYGEINVSL